MNLNNIDISKLPADVRRKYKQLQVMHAEKKIQNKAKDDFLSFVKCMWPDFIEGSHHRHIANKFNNLYGETFTIPEVRLQKESMIIVKQAHVINGGTRKRNVHFITEKGRKACKKPPRQFNYTLLVK